jgi:hypothetical protein
MTVLDFVVPACATPIHYDWLMLEVVSAECSVRSMKRRKTVLSPLITQEHSGYWMFVMPRVPSSCGDGAGGRSPMSPLRGPAVVSVRQPVVWATRGGETAFSVDWVCEEGGCGSR